MKVIIAFISDVFKAVINGIFRLVLQVIERDLLSPAGVVNLVGLVALTMITLATLAVALVLGVVALLKGHSSPGPVFLYFLVSLLLTFIVVLVCPRICPDFWLVSTERFNSSSKN